MNEVRLTGQLVCKNEQEAGLVAEYLPEHISLTRAEPECLSFGVTQIGDSLIWQVEERFSCEAAFESHQERVAMSVWGRNTIGISRSYLVEGLAS